VSLEAQCWDHFSFYCTLPVKISSTIRLYTDDVLLYREINSEEDILTLQEDLSAIALWAQEWLMLLYISLCEHLTITNKRNVNPINSAYKLNDQILNKVTKAKYLGVTINQTLSWHDHIINICNNANSTCAFLQRNLRREIFETVRFILNPLHTIYVCKTNS